MYKRFLNNNDYIGIVTEEALEQLIRGNEERLAQAEEAAEESLIEYLTENYEIESVLQAGKDILEYNTQITYPAGAHFYVDGKIYKSTRVIHGRKSPTLYDYWTEYDSFIQDLSQIPFYTQSGSYMPGDLVMLGNKVFQCLNYNGIDYNNVRVPGAISWGEVTTTEWMANQVYLPWSVVSFEGKYYALLNDKNEDWTADPFNNDNWGLIGTYDPELNTYSLSDNEYVEFEGKVFVPYTNPNSDELREGYNMILHDPRHPNVKKHLLRLAVYELHKLISPTNISSTRITDYETSIAWLRDASRLRINPHIPRKVDSKDRPVVDFAMATFIRDYDPYQNPWQI